MTGKTSLGWAAWVLVACAACRAPASTEPAAGPSLSEVRQQLAARDARLGGYDVSGESLEGTHRARFSFSFRPPQRLQGRIVEPAAQTLSFDGRTFFQRDDATGALQVTDLHERPADEVSQALHGIFGAFVAEGWRAPLLPSSTKARKVPHPKGPEAVELAIDPDGTGSLRVTYVLRWPSMDFLEKRFEQDGKPIGGIRVDDERCEATRSLCVPIAWTHVSHGLDAASVRLTGVRFGQDVDPVEFTLPAPAVREPVGEAAEAPAVRGPVGEAAEAP